MASAMSPHVDPVQSHAPERGGIDPGLQRPPEPEVVLVVVVRLDRRPGDARGLERREDLHLAREMGDVGRRVRPVSGVEDDAPDAGRRGRLDRADAELRLPRVERRQQVEA